MTIRACFCLLALVGCTASFTRVTGALGDAGSSPPPGGSAAVATAAPSVPPGSLVATLDLALPSPHVSVGAP